jgi:hypothetical protein
MSRVSASTTVLLLIALAAVATALALSGGMFGSQHSAAHSVRTIDRASLL